MPVVRNSKASKSSNDRQSGNCISPIQPRRSARLASRHTHAVPSDKPIVPSRQLLERQGPKRSFDTYKPVDPADLSKQPAWPKFNETGPHGTRGLQREYSFVLADCGTHFEMVSPKTVGHFSRVPQCLGTIAPYHNFGSDVGEEELRRKLRAKIVKKDDEDAKTTALAGSTRQTRKRGRSEDDDEEGRAANNVKRKIKKAKVTRKT